MERLSDGTLIGLVSFGGGVTDPELPCISRSKPSVYARVTFARDWIKNVTKI
jgi:secreted trypsin-like serine protease